MIDLASLVAQLLKNLPAMQETWVQSVGWEDHGEGKGYPLQYSGLENSMDCIVHGVAKSQTQLSDFHSIKISFRELLLESNQSPDTGTPFLSLLPSSSYYHT